MELLQGMIEAKLAGANAKLVEGVAEPAALPAPSRKPRRKRGAEARASPYSPTSRARANGSPANRQSEEMSNRLEVHRGA